jgi:hypothetical protein
MRRRILISAVSLAVTLALIVVSFLFGALIAGTGLHDPDSCWLIALGRYIFEHTSLPQSDPFSYTFASLHRPFIMYQWGTELIYYTLVKYMGLSGLLMVCAVLATITFIGLPLIFSRQLSNVRFATSIIAVLLVLSVCFHVLVRPELFSYVLLSLFMYWLLEWRRKIFEITASPEKSASTSNLAVRRPLFFLQPAMLAWVNLHSGFTLGIMAATATGISYLFYRRKQIGTMLLIAGPIVLTAFTLLNPFGYQLWKYLPSLYFSPINAYISELKPVGLRELQEPTYYPFLILSIYAVTLLVRNWRRHLRLSQQSTTPPVDGIWLSTVNILFSIYAGLSARRMIAFTAIVLAFESIFMLHVFHAALRPHMEENEEGSFVSGLNKKLEALFVPGVVSTFVWFGLAALFGAYIVTSRIAPPSLPQASSVLQVPTAAIQYLKEHNPTRLFNDAQYGDIIIWQTGGTLPVFIDTRYDMYGNTFVRQYQIMRFCEFGYEKLLNSYGITDILVPAKSNLAKNLHAKAEWKNVFADETAAIFHRTGN